MTGGLVEPIAAARGQGFPLGVYAAPPPAEPGWAPARATGRDARRLEELLDRAAAAGVPSRAVAATWQLEKHAWYVAGAALAGLVAHGRLPPLDRALLRYGAEGWPDAIALPRDAWRPADGREAAAALEAHLAPLIEGLARHRARRPLWRSAADRLGQAALWCADAFDDGDRAIALATEALGAPTALHSPAGFGLLGGAPARRRTGCCLAYRCPGLTRCDDCANPARLGAVATHVP